MKTKLLIVIFLMISLFITACSSKPSNGAGVKVTEENVDYLSEYEQTLQSNLEELTSILSVFNLAVDDIYTKEISNGEFAKTLKDLIGESNTLVTTIETLDIHPDLFEANQMLANLVNRSHQLLLDAVDMANEADTYDIDKERLRAEYLEIKTEQATLKNQWKVFREDISKGSSQ